MNKREEMQNLLNDAKQALGTAKNVTVNAKANPVSMEKISSRCSSTIVDVNTILATTEVIQAYEVVKMAFDETMKAAQIAIHVAEQAVTAVEDAKGKMWLSGKLVENLRKQVIKAQFLANEARNCENVYSAQSLSVIRSIQRTIVQAEQAETKQRQDYASQYKQFADNAVKICLSNDELCKSVTLNPQYESVLLQEKIWRAINDFKLSLQTLTDIIHEFGANGGIE